MVKYKNPGVYIEGIPEYISPICFASENLVFLMVDFDSRHLGGSTINERFLQAAKEYAFFLWQTRHPDFQPK